MHLVPSQKIYQTMQNLMQMCRLRQIQIISGLFLNRSKRKIYQTVSKCCRNEYQIYEFNKLLKLKQFTRLVFPTAPTMSAVGKEPHLSSFSFFSPGSKIIENILFGAAFARKVFQPYSSGTRLSRCQRVFLPHRHRTAEYSKNTGLWLSPAY